jgi:hypothetical protein
MAFIPTLGSRRLHRDDLARAATSIQRLQRPDGAIVWHPAGKLDPWDHVEAAMGLAIMGNWPAAERAFAWLAANQRPEGSWQRAYFTDSEPPGTETHFVAYVATGIWHYFLVTGDQNFLQTYFAVAKQALNFVLQFQTADGDIAWALDADGRAQPDALLTGCSSIAQSLAAGICAAERLGEDTTAWRQAWRQLRDALLHKPERFDRTWPSKARFAMDWYYPILAGLYPPVAAQARLSARFDEFVVTGLGCRCVSDEPWVTMAETAELVMALVAAGDRAKAETLFDTLAQWQDQDGGFVMGYVFRDQAIWPDDKTSWTAGAVILAADALWNLTPASTLFTQPLLTPLGERLL